MMVYSVQDGIMKHVYNFVTLDEVYLIRTVVSFTCILIFLILNETNFFYFFNIFGK